MMSIAAGGTRLRVHVATWTDSRTAVAGITSTVRKGTDRRDERVILGTAAAAGTLALPGAAAAPGANAAAES